MAELVAASRDLRRLAAGAHLGSVPLRTGPPTPLASLRRFYAAAERRFGVEREILAAINFVESDFGRVRSRSVAGAQGPMQFVPSTWRVYGLGGDIQDPHDAILGAANLLRADGAPGDYAAALLAYNPSDLYVDAIQRYARLMKRDQAAFYLLYAG
jgi:membrane-bound lytic murein transglycosylase B